MEKARECDSKFQNHMRRKYNDEYPTCKRTYATLCIYHNDLAPSELSTFLGLRPTHSQQKGKVDLADPTRRNFAPKIGGWFLSSRDKVTSKDNRRHLNWLLDKLNRKRSKLLSLQRKGFSMHISCYWLSTQGHGGPTLSVEIMQRLARLNLEVWFDVY
jgi:hypothetical protein